MTYKNKFGSSFLKKTLGGRVSLKKVYKPKDYI